jgi:prevent-host-death family protein
VTRFRAQCLELIRQVESGGEVVEITRHGKTVARLTPPAGSPAMHPRPWERLRGSGELAMEPEESVLDAGSFDALR